MTSVPLETVIRAPANVEAFALPRESFVELKHGQPRELRCHDSTSRTRSTRSCSRGHTKTRKKRQPTLRQRTRAEFEEEFRRMVLSGVFSSCEEELWKDLRKWISELRTVAQEEERRQETRELRRMVDEDRNPRSRQARDQIRSTDLTLLWCRREARRIWTATQSHSCVNPSSTRVLFAAHLTWP